MSGWILILLLFGERHAVVQIAPVPAPFESYDACWRAGHRASSCDDLNVTPERPPAMVEFLCVPQGDAAALADDRAWSAR